MVTIHSYTGDQRTVDTLHKDLHRARAAALSMIPTSTGAAKALGLVIPELVGKLGRHRDPGTHAERIPGVAGCEPCAAVDVAAINALFKTAAEGLMKGILEYNTEKLVSTDFNGVAASCTFDATQTASVDGGRLVRIAGWYDNEWGFSSRMSDTAALWGGM